MAQWRGSPSDDAQLNADPLALLAARAPGRTVFTARLFGEPTLCMADSATSRAFFHAERNNFVIEDKCPAQHHELFGDSVFSQTGADHQEARRLLGGALRPAAVLSGYARRLAPLCATAVQRWTVDGVPDLARDCRTLTVDVCGQVLLGLDDQRALDDFRAAFAAFSAGPTVPPRLRRWRPRYRRALRGRATIRRLVAATLNDTEIRPDTVLGQLADAVQPADDGVPALPDHVLALLIAAGETTASLVFWCLVELARADGGDRLRAEAGRAMAQPRLLVDRASTPGLRALLAEVERVHPPNAVVLRRAVNDCTVAGVLIPAGTRVAYLPAAANYDPLLFAEPDRFDPRRFAERDAAALLTFGAGVRACPGKQFAELVALSAMSAVLADHCPRLAGEPDVPRHLPVKAPVSPVALRLERTADER